MPRSPREKIQSEYVHLMTQGINKEKILKKDEYKRQYLKYVYEIFNQYSNLKLLVYCIMDNHTHFIIHATDIKELSQAMKKINTKYAIYYNKKEDRVGYVFRNRYTTQQILDREQLYNTIVYIHKNPIKAGITNNMENYMYSSYKDFKSGKLEPDIAELLFQSKEYLRIFNYIHKNFNENIVYDIEEMHDENIDKELQKAIWNFCEQKNISVETIKDNNDLILQLVLKLKEKINVTEKEIAIKIGIGKNRITEIKKKLKD